MFSSLRKAAKPRCLILNWSRRHSFSYATKTWNLWLFFVQFFESFHWKKYKIYSTGDEECIESIWQQQLKVIMYYIISWAFHKLSSRQNECTYPEKLTILYFSLTLKDTEIFPKLLFWRDPWVTAPVFHNRFLVINLYLMTVVIHTKQRMWENRERERNYFITMKIIKNTTLFYTQNVINYISEM